jgi:subtilisin-like proprotein convertase family protein
MKVMSSIPDVSRHTLNIEEYLKTKNPGDLVTYKELEKLTGISINDGARQYLYTAMRRLKLEHETIRGVGIKLGSPENATKIVVQKVVKVDGSVRRAEKTHRNISTSFIDQLSPEEKKQMHYTGAIFGAIRLYSQQGKKIASQQAIQLANL